MLCVDFIPVKVHGFMFEHSYSTDGTAGRLGHQRRRCFPPLPLAARMCINVLGLWDLQTGRCLHQVNSWRQCHLGQWVCALLLYKLWSL